MSNRIPTPTMGEILMEEFIIQISTIFEESQSPKRISREKKSRKKSRFSC